MANRPDDLEPATSTSTSATQEPSADAGPLGVRRLGWAAIEVEFEGVKLGVDLLEDLSPLVPITGEARTGLLPAEGPLAAALVTHLHADHADASAIDRALAPDGVVLRPPPARGEGLETIATAGAEEGLGRLEARSEQLEPWQAVEVGPFTVTAVPAADGFGDPQLSWVIEAGGRSLLHGGDTIFHGSWWLIAMRHGPFDAVFLPVNGPICDLPHRQPPSPFSAAMDPQQAAAAARLLGARRAVPIHYDTIHSPPVYSQVDDPAGAFAVAAAEAGVEALVLETGESVEL